MKKVNWKDLHYTSVPFVEFAQFYCEGGDNVTIFMVSIQYVKNLKSFEKETCIFFRMAVSRL